MFKPLVFVAAAAGLAGASALGNTSGKTTGAAPARAASAAPAAVAAPALAPAAAAVRGAAVQVPESDAMRRLQQKLESKLGVHAPASSRLPGEIAIATRSPDAPQPVPAQPRATPLRHEATAKAPHWSYDGPGGPQAWGRLEPGFAACANGRRQSPIDLRDSFRLQLDPVQFDYQPSAFRVVDNGHTIEVRLAPGNSIRVMGRRYELSQFHFHRPSEERIDGRAFDMTAHLVHRDPEGRLAVVAVLLERGSAQPVVQAVWNNLPLERGEELAAQAPIDPAALLPAERGYFVYMGSLTTPPCTEGVLWMVMRQPVPVAPEQIDIFARLYPMNARPVQPAAGRIVKESQ